MKKLISIFSLLLVSLAVFADNLTAYQNYVYSGSGKTEFRFQKVTSFKCTSNTSLIPLTFGVTAISVKRDSVTKGFAKFENKTPGTTVKNELVIADTDVDETVRVLTQMLPVIHDGFKGNLANGETYQDCYMNETGFSVGYSVSGGKTSWFIIFGRNDLVIFCSPETLLEVFTSAQKAINAMKGIQ